eukprot:787436_1
MSALFSTNKEWRLLIALILFAGTWILLNSGTRMIIWHSNSYASPPHDDTHQTRKIFIDLGAYTGDTLLLFIRFRADSDEYIAYAWEADSRNLNRLVTAINSNSDYNNKLKYISVIPKAVWMEDDRLGYGGTRGSGKAGHVVVNSKKPISTNALQFSGWLVKHVTVNDYVFLKIDIECVEFLLLQDLFATNTIDLIDEIQIEWHDRMAMENKCNDAGVEGNTEQIRALRDKLHNQLKQNGLVYQYATPSISITAQLAGNKTWDDVPKYIEEKDYPLAWVDLHYFRKQANPHLNSPWAANQ